MRTTAILGGIFVIGSMAVAHADLNGTTLKNKCSNSDTSFCLGYIVGARDSMHDINDLLKPKDGFFCQPPSATGEQIFAVVQKYLNDHPERLHYRASSLVTESLREAFSCPTK